MRSVAAEQIVKQDRETTSVDDRVMQRQQDAGIVGGILNDGSPNQWRLGQRKPVETIRQKRLLKIECTLVRRDGSAIQEAAGWADAVNDLLLRLVTAVPDEPRPQDRMDGHKRLQRSSERGRINPLRCLAHDLLQIDPTNTANFVVQHATLQRRERVALGSCIARGRFWCAVIEI